MDKKSEYRFECELSDDFQEIINSTCRPWKIQNFIKEYFYGSGKTDIVALDQYGNIISFELKLNKWNKALEQAYRNTSFADISFIVLPKDVAYCAFKFKNEFIRRKVGICFINNGIIEILIDPPKSTPIHSWRNEFLKLEIGCED